MGMTVDDLAWVRAEVGAAPDDATLNANFDRLGGRATVALEIWRGRYADMLRAPASLSADGLSQGTSANLAEMTKHIRWLEVLAGKENTDPLRSGFLVRPDRPGPAAVFVESAAYAALDRRYL